MVRHACRTLIKQGHQPTLAALGYGRATVTIKDLHIKTPVVTYGNALEFGFELESKASESQALIFDFIVRHRKANGETSPKVFKGKTFDLAAGGSIEITKKHAMKPITTRVYYPGTHGLAIQINGQTVGQAEFELVMP